MKAEDRDRHNTDAMLHPAPDVPGLQLRPFNDAVLALCGELGLTLFTLEAFAGDMSNLSAKAESIGAKELNRQCLTLIYILGFEDRKQMLRHTRDPEFYANHVLPWSIDLPADPARIGNLLSEWRRYMVHMAAAIVKVIPRGEADPDAPPNS
jgi:hypothetical protein